MYLSASFVFEKVHSYKLKDIHQVGLFCSTNPDVSPESLISHQMYIRPSRWYHTQVHNHHLAICLICLFYLRSESSDCYVGIIIIYILLVYIVIVCDWELVKKQQFIEI